MTCANSTVIADVVSAVDNRSALADLLSTCSNLVNWSKFTSNSYEEWIRTTSDFDFFGYRNKEKEQYDMDQAKVLKKILGLQDLNLLEEDELEGEFFDENFQQDDHERISALSNKLKGNASGTLGGGLSVPMWK